MSTPHTYLKPLASGTVIHVDPATVRSLSRVRSCLEIGERFPSPSRDSSASTGTASSEHVFAAETSML